MIDREARRQLVNELKRLATGKITDYEFQGRIEHATSSKDFALSEVATHFYIGYDSAGFIPQIRYDGKHRMRKSERFAIAKAILFLRGDYEVTESSFKGYCLLALAFIFILASFISADYPQWMFVIIAAILIGVPVLGTAFWRIREKFVEEIWPFKNQAEYEVARRRPYLGAQRILNS